MQIQEKPIQCSENFFVINEDRIDLKRRLFCKISLFIILDIKFIDKYICGYMKREKKTTTTNVFHWSQTFNTCTYIQDRHTDERERERKKHLFVCKIERNKAQIDSTTCLVVHYVQDYQGQKMKREQRFVLTKKKKKSTITIDTQHSEKKMKITHTHIERERDKNSVCDFVKCGFFIA